MRFICTHIIAYKHPDGIIWPDPAIYSISNTSLPDNQYQVSSYSGILMLGILYWIQEGKVPMIWIAVASLIISINLELSYRISYCTGTRMLDIDIFAALLIAHLFSSLNKVWCRKLDSLILSSITNYWEKKTKTNSEEK